MKRRKFLFIALVLALPLALVVPLRAARSWQPRVLELPHHIYADTTEFFWRINGLTVAKYTGGAPQLSMHNWDGALVPIRSLPAQSAALDRKGRQGVRLYNPEGDEARIELWDVESGQIQRAATAQLHARNADKNHLSRASCMAISPDGTRVAWPGFKTYGVIIADTATGRETARFVVPTRDASGPIKKREVFALAWSRDQSQLAIAGSTYVAIVDATSGKLRHFWRKHEYYANRLAWSPDGHMLALAWGHGYYSTSLPQKNQPTTHKFLFVHDVQSGAIRGSWSEDSYSRAEAQGVTNLDFAPDGEHLAWGTYNGKALMMNLKSGVIEQRFGLQISPDEPPGFGPMGMGDSPNAQYVAYSPDGRTLALASIYRVVLRRVR